MVETLGACRALVSVLRGGELAGRAHGARVIRVVPVLAGGARGAGGAAVAGAAAGRAVSTRLLAGHVLELPRRALLARHRPCSFKRTFH